MIFQDLHIMLSIALHLWCDNISAIALAFNSVFHLCTNHIKIDYHLIKEKVVNHDIQVKYISMQDQIADNVVF
jgi:histone deacetylase 1/2